MSSIICAVAVDPVLTNLVMLGAVVIAIGFLLRWLKQPYVVAYIIAGVAIGPSGFGMINDAALIDNLGQLGLILLMFFIGMEISPAHLMANWRIPVIGTLLQLLISIGVVWGIGIYFDWAISRIIMLGFVITMSSTAVIIKVLQERKESDTPVGQSVIGILIVQDIIIVPMLIAVNYLGGNQPATAEVIRQIIGGVIVIGAIIFLLKKRQINLPFSKQISQDHEIQVFVALTTCFGFAIITALFGLSSALGALVAGMMITAAKSTEWVHDSLHPFRVVFVAFFFVSVGMLINLDFLKENVLMVAALVMAVFLINNVINTLVIRLLGEPWKHSIYAGALLSQIGEFSFILGSTGYFMGIITPFGYQLIVCAIALTLLLSPVWISTVRLLTHR